MAVDIHKPRKTKWQLSYEPHHNELILFWVEYVYLFNRTKTRPSLDSEAVTMYKLKGKSSNMRTGQGFK